MMVVTTQSKYESGGAKPGTATSNLPVVGVETTSMSPGLARLGTLTRTTFSLRARETASGALYAGASYTADSISSRRCSAAAMAASLSVLCEGSCGARAAPAPASSDSLAAISASDAICLELDRKNSSSASICRWNVAAFCCWRWRAMLFARVADASAAFSASSAVREAYSSPVPGRETPCRRRAAAAASGLNGGGAGGRSWPEASS
mmetsp:Transcript_22328/g.75524  ORF Transcript_22328/g.75524 Transcript_22328/m.75524 type:complete len:207 (+) Transcript_22328:708-1328(+)